MTRTVSATRPVPRRLLSRDEAAMYIAMSPSTFDKLVNDGRMPEPIAIGDRRVWDIRKLDLAIDELADGNYAPKKNSWGDR